MQISTLKDDNKLRKNNASDKKYYIQKKSLSFLIFYAK